VLVHFYVKFLMYIYDFLKMSLINITYQLLNYYVKRGESPKRSCTTMRRGGGSAGCDPPRRPTLFRRNGLTLRSPSPLQTSEVQTFCNRAT
jgi:hypothetical protein